MTTREHGIWRRALSPVLLAALAAWLVPATGAVTIEPLARLPFELGPRGHVLVPVSVNGTPAVFALDTGATTNVVAARWAQTADPGLPDGAAAEVIGAHGSGGAAMTRIGRLEVGTIAVRDEPALIMDLAHVEGPDMRLDGLIGVPLLEDYDVVLDFGAAAVSFYPRGSIDRLRREQPHTGSDMLDAGPDLSVHANLVLVEVRRDGVPLTAVLDTGSGRSGINSAAAAALGITLPAGFTGTPDHGGGHGAVAALPSMEITLGDGRLSSRDPVAIVDLPAFESLGLGRQPAMLLGTNFLEGRRVGLDYAARRVYLFD
jgi:predicted aspartyl protease